MVSHAVEDLTDLVDRLIVLQQGRILASGSPEEVFSFLLQAGKVTFLVPPLFRLVHELRAQGWALPAHIWRVEEALPLIDQCLRAGTRKATLEN